MRQVWYPENGKRRLEDMSSIGLMEEVQKGSRASLKRNPRKAGTSPNQLTKDGESRKEDKKVSESKKVQKTVFDLKEFDNVLLAKFVQLPEKPEDVESALKMIGNDTKEIVEVIYQGIVAREMEKARSDMSGFKVADDDGEPTDEDYAGTFADEDKGKLIRGAILGLAKVQGFDKSKTPEEKRALKKKAAEFLRSNPAILQSIQG